jgi:6-phosphogluconolactonase
MELHIQKDPDQVSHDLANWIVGYVDSVIKKQNRFTWALSGGNSPKQLYELLAQPENSKKVLWEKLHIFFGDERCVPFSDSRNNGKMSYDALLKHVPIPEEQIHYMRTDVAPEESLLLYEKLLHYYFDHSQSTFDLVLLGLGVDGHTLSLFPRAPFPKDENQWIVSIYNEEENMHRLSLTPVIVNRASAVIFLVTGKNKSSIVEAVLQGTQQPEIYPACLIKPQSGELHWFLDAEAASGL